MILLWPIFNCLIEFSSNRKQTFGKYQVIQAPGKVFAPRNVPEHINRPPYYKTDIPPPGPSVPEIKSSEQIEKMRKSCALARRVLNYSKSILKVLSTFLYFESLNDVSILILRLELQLMKLTHLYMNISLLIKHIHHLCITEISPNLSVHLLTTLFVTEYLTTDYLKMVTLLT